MSRAEDYLDGLLDSLEGKKTPEPVEDVAGLSFMGEEAVQEAPEPIKMEAQDPEDEFLDAFEKEFLLGEDADDFIRQFEKELAEEGQADGADMQSGMAEGALETAGMQAEESLEMAGMQDGEADGGFADLDDIMSSTHETMDLQDEFAGQDAGFAESNDDMDIMVDTMGELDFPVPDAGKTPDMSDSLSASEESADLSDVLNGFGDFSEDLFAAEDNGTAAEDIAETSDMTDAFDMTDMSDMTAASDSANDDDLMSLLQSDGAFSDMGDLPNSEEGSEMFTEDGQNETGDFSLEGLSKAMAADDVEVKEDAALEEEPAGDKKSRKERKKAKKQKKDKKEKQDKEESNGFLQRMGKLLFGEDEEEAEAAPVKKEPVAATPSIEEFSDANLDILQALGGMEETVTEAAPQETEDPKEKKKREKKEKQAKAKAEKKAKQEQAKKERAEKKAKKVKAPKKPKEPDSTPPLPKKPVILVFVMVASFLVLVILGTDLFGYSSSMANANKEFGLGNYEAAFREVAGMEIKEEDLAVYEKYCIMANTAGEYSSYQSFMEAKIYDMALDSLIRAVGRSEKYRADAELYECTGELDKIRGQAVSALAGFGIDEERALELYAESKRKDYSAELYAILEEAGLSVE